MVSIVVPVYNAANYIADTIKMVCEQTYRDWELILVDDASTDNSVSVIEDIIKGQKKRIRLIRKRVNEGAAEARNTGIDASAGRFIAFLDADDVWKRDKLKKQVAFMEDHGYAFSYTKYGLMDNNSKDRGVVIGGKEHVTHKDLLKCCWPHDVLVLDRTVDVNITRLRKKLGPYGKQIKTRVGYGYCFEK